MTSNNVRKILKSKWSAKSTGPFFKSTEPPPKFVEPLPKDYLDVIRDFGGKEGFLGQTYLRLYRLEELIQLNIAYQVPTLLPEVFIFGSNGYGEAFAFLLFEQSLVQVPFLPL